MFRPQFYKKILENLKFLAQFLKSFGVWSYFEGDSNTTFTVILPKKFGLFFSGGLIRFIANKRQKEETDDINDDI